MTGPHDADKVADAVLFEGYLLYPYRPSALKNRHRYPFGTLYPESFCRAHEAGDASTLELQIVVRGGPATTLGVRLRFLYIPASPPPAPPETREVRLEARLIRSCDEAACAPVAVGVVRGALAVAAARIGEDAFKVTVRVRNNSDLAHPEQCTRDEALSYAIASPHLVLSVVDGAFISMIDPPPVLRDIASACRSHGTWPVLLGTPGDTDTVLAAPIILEDYPQIAPESPGDFFDGTEVDELLTLRVLTLTDAEKREMAASDERARSLLERTEALGLEALRTLHGAVRTLTPGTQVRIRPNERADIMDVVLADKRATVRAVERDYEGRMYVVVTVDEDPGQDLGAFGHRFFFRPDELEPL